MESALERYQQEAATAAAYMDIKSRHFGAFLILNGVLFAGVFELESVAHLHFVTSVVGVVVTVLFLLIDLRTRAYLTGHLGRSEAALKDLVGGTRYAPPAPAARVGVSALSTTIYGLVATLWLLVALVSKGVIGVPGWACDAPAAVKPVAPPAASPVAQQPEPPPVRFAC